MPGARAARRRRSSSVFATAMRKRASRSVASARSSARSIGCTPRSAATSATPRSLERAVGRVLRDHHVVEAPARARPRRRASRSASRNVGIGVDALLAPRSPPPRPARIIGHALEREGRLELELELERPARHLRDHAHALALQLRVLLEDAAVARRARACRASSAVQRDRPAGRPRDRRRTRRGRGRGPIVACMTPCGDLAERAGERLDLGDAPRRGSAPGCPRSRRASATSRSRSRARPPRAPRATMRAHARDLVRASPRARSPPRPSRRGAAACGRRSAPTLIAVPRASIASRNSGKRLEAASRSPSPARSASSDMPSTFSSVRRIRSRCAGRVGAMPKPQLPDHDAS